jgi:hypothetical protein
MFEKLNYFKNRNIFLLKQLGIDGYAFVFYLIASSVAVARARSACDCGELGVAGFFGFASILVSVLEAIYFIIQWKRGTIELITTTTITTPNPDGGVTTNTTKTTIYKQESEYPVVY